MRLWPRISLAVAVLLAAAVAAAQPPLRFKVDRKGRVQLPSRVPGAYGGVDHAVRDIQRVGLREGETHRFTLVDGGNRAMLRPVTMTYTPKRRGRLGRLFARLRGDKSGEVTIQPAVARHAVRSSAHVDVFNNLKRIAESGEFSSPVAASVQQSHLRQLARGQRSGRPVAELPYENVFIARPGEALTKKYSKASSLPQTRGDTYFLEVNQIATPGWLKRVPLPSDNALDKGTAYLERAASRDMSLIINLNADLSPKQVAQRKSFYQRAFPDKQIRYTTDFGAPSR